MTMLRVLAVDDEAGMIQAIDRTLRSFVVDVPESEEPIGLAVESASTGEEAVERILQAPPDLLLLDYKLPGMSGLDVLKTTAGRTGDMLTVMITAYASIQTAVAATKQGAYDFLPKPFTPADLKHTVRKAAVRIILARRARQLAEEKKRVRFEFIRVLGHELKAPLGAVEGYLNILESRMLGPELGAYAEVIQRSEVRLQQMRKLIVDLLDMTRLESGEKKREFGDVDLGKAAREAIELAGVEATKRGIVIRLEPDGAPTLRADRGEVDMVMNNLLTNAVKYNRDGGQVRVAVRAEEGGALIEVEDTGIGMSEAEVGRLFQEFSRIRNEKTAHILGSGLGLSILKRISELYRGQIEVESTPEKGSTFRIHLKHAE